MEEVLLRRITREAYGLRMLPIHEDIKSIVYYGNGNRRIWVGPEFAMTGSPIFTGEWAGGVPQKIPWRLFELDY
jgi:hypothetical protein